MSERAIHNQQPVQDQTDSVSDSGWNFFPHKLKGVSAQSRAALRVHVHVYLRAQSIPYE